MVEAISNDFDVKGALRVKEIERTTNHDVKAVEYFIKERLDARKETSHVKEFVHFCCTSEDINNLCYGRMISDALSEAVLPQIDGFMVALSNLALKSSGVPMLALTHGQAATPTTFGREMAVFVHRLKGQLDKLIKMSPKGKFNGATGSFNAHVVAYPEIDWKSLAYDFVTNAIGLEYQPVSTQIECHDYIAELSDVLSRTSTILIGFSRDMWTYISRHVLKLGIVAGEVGSSTMPHKVNPIDFENAEGNLGIAISLFNHFSSKLLISRLQRDLSDSTVLRNIGVAFAHFMIALDSLTRGISKVEVNEVACSAELDANWSVVAEAVQTVMRRHGVSRPYERLKDFTRGAEVDKTSMHAFIKSLASELPQDAIDKLMALSPDNYVGLSQEIAETYGQYP